MVLHLEEVPVPIHFNKKTLEIPAVPLEGQAIRFNTDNNTAENNEKN